MCGRLEILFFVIQRSEKTIGAYLVVSCDSIKWCIYDYFSKYHNGKHVLQSQGHVYALSFCRRRYLGHMRV